MRPMLYLSCPSLKGYRPYSEQDKAGGEVGVYEQIFFKN